MPASSLSGVCAAIAAARKAASHLARAVERNASRLLFLFAATITRPAPAVAQTKPLTITGVSPALTVTANNGTSTTVRVSWTIKNTGTAGTWVYVEADCGNWCNGGGDVAGYVTAIVPGQSMTYDFYPNFTSSSPTANTVSLTVRTLATASVSDMAYAFLDRSTMTATFASASPTMAITPATGTAVTSSPISQLKIDWCDANDAIVQHDVSWQGQALPDAYVATTRSGCYAAGTSTYSGVSIAPGAQNVVATARDATGNVVTATSTITFTPPVTAFQPSVTATAGRHALPGPAAVQAADTFTVKNVGLYAARYALSSTCESMATLTECYQSVSDVIVNPGASQSVVVHYTRSGDLDYPDTLKLIARYASQSGESIADTGRKVVIANSTYTPHVQRYTARTLSANGRRSFDVAVLDMGNAPATYTLTLSCTGAITSCTLPNSGTTMTKFLQPSSWSTATVGFNTSAVGSSGQIRLILTAPPRISDGVVQADTSAVTFTAAELVAPTITIQPFGGGIVGDGYYNVLHDTATVVVDFCDADGTLGVPTLKVSSLTTPPTSLVSTSTAGCFTSSRATYKPVFLDGYGDVYVTVSDGYHTATRQAWYEHDGSPENTPQITALHPTISLPANVPASDTFVVANRGHQTITYPLYLSCSASPYWLTCNKMMDSVRLAPGASIRVPVSYSVVGVGSWVRANLSADYNGTFNTTSASASFTATAVGTLAPTIAVTPANGTTVSSSPIAQVRIDWCDPDDGFARHDVTWQGQALPNTYVATTRSGCVAAGTSTYNNLAINPWQQSLVATAVDVAAHSVTSTTTITFAVPLSNFAPKVATATDWHRLPGAGAVTAADTFTIKNAGTEAASYSVSALCAGTSTLSGCTPNKGSLSLAPGGSDVVVVTFTRSGALDVADTLKLVAAYTSPLGGTIADTGRKVVVAPSVEVAPVVAGTSPSFSMSPTVVMGTGWFTLRNTSSVRIRYNLAFATTGGFGIRYSADTLTLNAGQTGWPAASVIAPSTAGTSGTLTVTASYVTTSGQTLSGTATVQLLTTGSQSNTIALKVLGASAPLLAPNGNATVTFTVQNTSSVSATVNYTRGCSGAAIAVCGPLQHQSATLSGYGSDVVGVDITAAASGVQSGSVTLTATSGSVTASGTVNVATGIVNGPLAMSAAGQLNPGTSISRDQCLTIAAGDGAAYECGDLRLVHSMPTTTTMNKARTPTLIYVSAHAHPVTLVAADVSVNGSICPTQLTVTVRFTDTDKEPRVVPWNAPCGQTSTRRVVVPVDAQAHSHGTGIYHYTLEVAASANGTNYSVSDTSGVMAVVNRATSGFGAGWWLDGVEQLYTVAGRADQLLWIGGDGSTRLYTKQGSSSTFLVQPTVDRPDTLELLTGGGYKRHLRNGAYVQFDGLLQHVATVNTAGHATRFFWSSSRLDSIALPVPNPADLSARRVYKLSYTAGVLTSVAAPPGPRDARVTSLARSTQSGLNDLAVTDPGDPAAHYLSDAAGRITIRRNRMGDGTRFHYDSASSVLTRVAIDLTRTNGGTDSIRTVLCPGEASSLASCANTLVDPAKVRTLLDGPRSDVADTTGFYLTAFGAPRVVVDALGNATTIERMDARWPLLATATVQANSHRVEAAYTDRGLVAEVRDINPFGRDANEIARTKYHWDSMFDKPDTVTAPTGETSRFGYFSNGDRRWQEDGRGAISRVWFTYNAIRQLASIQPPGNGPSQLQRLEYDPASGNMAREITPLNDTTFYHADAIGRVDSIASPANDTQQQSERFVFDVADRLLRHQNIGPAVDNPHGTAPAVTLSDTTIYDAESRPLSVERRSEPDLAITGHPLTTSTYDAAGRKLTEIHVGSRHQAWAYDPAGNVTAWTTGGFSAGADVIVHTTYDALNRPLRRVMPQVTRPAQRGEARLFCQHAPRFPYFAYLTSGPTYDPTAEAECDDVSGPLPHPLVIPSDVADFTYDAIGNLKTANNNDARIARDYFPNGALKSETQAIAIFDDLTPLDGRFNTHRYRLDFTYDLSGRRLTRTDGIPDCVGCVQTYHYDPASGFLDGTSDGGATHSPTQFAFYYDGAGRMSYWTVNGTTSRTDLYYDPNGRMTGRSVTGAGTTIYQDGISYDRSGRVTSTSITSDVGGIAGSTSSWYNGLGALAYFSQDRNGTLLDDEFVTDGLGNRVRDKRWFEGHYTTHEYRYTRELLDQVNQITPWQSGDPPPPTSLQTGDTTSTNYGSSGAVEHEFRAGFQFNTTFNTWQIDTLGDEWVWHAYGADEKLRVSQRSVEDPQTHTRTSFTDYRYDALGRRVAVRTRWDPFCQRAAPECLSTIERTIWDGDQILMQLRSPAGSETEVGSGNFQGAVRYTHGGGIDEPLAIWKDNVGGLVPHRSWRGTYEDGTPIDQNSRNVTWPARTQDVFHAPDVRLDPIQPSDWMGSIVDGKTDPSGLQYMRNRYYDAKSGRFTQEDPIGLAGGMNLYGFGGGDPVNNSDPFGLCPPCDGTGAIGGVAGALGGAAGAASALIGATSDANMVAAGINAAIDWLKDKTQVKFVTYTRTAPDGQVYSGRTSGFGDPQSIVNARARQHPNRLAGFGPPVVDQWATGFTGGMAIWGREQQLIDAHGRARSEGGTSANIIRSVGKNNPAGPLLWDMSNSRFGPLSSYSGRP